jgi:hypothetical protein
MMTSWIDIRAAEDGIMTATSVVAYVMSMLSYTFDIVYKTYFKPNKQLE